MTVNVVKTILAKGYFPKELPPAFTTHSFAEFAVTPSGASLLSNYKPTDYFTECCEFKVARTGNESRDFKIPHPHHFTKLTNLCASAFPRLLKLGSASPFASSRPTYSPSYSRAIRPATVPGNLPRDRSLSRASSAYLLKTDISHFYPSLYTHAVGWAIDPKLRQKQHWKNSKLLGKKIDQNLMDLDKKFSQGIPIGNDLSFLLAEIVLAAVDKSLAIPTDRCYRWFDDYEVACDTENEALALREALESALAHFRLRLNPQKTKILRLPQATQDGWQDALIEASGGNLGREREMIKYFDLAFRLRSDFPEEPILSFALGVLFRLAKPNDRVGRVAESAISQALLCEPGCSQKALSLISYWKLNGFSIDMNLFRTTFGKLILQSVRKGTHDLIWGLSFCLDNGITLDEEPSEKLREVENDLITLVSLHMHRKKLLAKSYNKRLIASRLRHGDLDREHWLLLYETARHGFLKGSTSIVNSNILFSEMLKAKVSFYQIPTSSFSYVVAPGCAPQWLIQSWLREASSTKKPKSQKVPDKLRKIIKLSIMERDGEKISPSDFRTFLRLHDLNQQTATPTALAENYGD